MKIPTREECEKLWDENNVPDNIRRHMILVNKVAMFLGKRLKEKGEKIDLELLDRASLLHDLDKIATLKTGGHGRMTKEILTKKGHSRVGHLAFMHRFGEIKNLKTWEEKLINYADKRCLHDTLVSLEERFRDARERYNFHATSDSMKLEEKFFELEKEIFSRIRMKPGELKQHIK